MFQTGLLATFIPEILMVIGYLLCLFVSNPSPETETVAINQIATYSSGFERVQASTYSVRTSDFQFVEQPVVVDVAPLIYCSSEPDTLFVEPYFQLSDSRAYVQFSRPPPVFIV